MLYIISIHFQSEKIRNRKYRKVYAIDWALANELQGIQLFSTKNIHSY